MIGDPGPTVDYHAESDNRCTIPDGKGARSWHWHTLLPRQPRSAQILTVDSVQQQPIAAPEGSEINHGIHRNPRKRESESTSPFRVLPCFQWLPVCDELSCRGNKRHRQSRIGNETPLGGTSIR